MSKTVTTPAGTVLPLMNLKGKDYLMVAHRLQWFNEAEHSFRIETSFSTITDEQTVAHAKVTVFNKEGREVKSVTGTKRETKKDFPDHTEKAETGAVGRALAMAGYGTQFAVSDLDEGSRLADAPLAAPPKTAAKAAPATMAVTPEVVTVTPNTQVTTPATPVKVSTFRKPKAEPQQASGDDGWK